MSVSTAYISIGANRSSSCAASTSSGILAFGAGNAVALWDTTDSSCGVFATLLGHRGQVTTLKRVRETPNGVTFVSGDSTGEVRIWEGTGKEFACTHNFVAHKGSISALGVVPTQGKAEILTGGSDGLVRRWRVGQKAKEVEKIDLRGRLALDLDLALLPGSSVPVLVVGCTDRKVQVWTLAGTSFRHAISLEGHEDWVRCVSLTPYPRDNGEEHDLLLATGAQDNYIRLWRITPAVDAGLDMFDEFEQRMSDTNVQISTKAHVLSVDDGGAARRYSVALEALLLGHEAGLTNVHWSNNGDGAEGALLLSSAADNSLIIWSPTDVSGSKDGIWIPDHRFGAFGGRGLSFFGAVWGPRNESVIAMGWTGGVERWVRTEDGWEASSGLTGHFGAVQSVAWDPAGHYLLSTGSDQTSRIHAPCTLSGSNLSRPVWAEIARPQIHGYDLEDAEFLSPFRIASAADEKTLRVFDATEGFAASLRGLGVCEVPKGEEANLPKGATVPPLGLSNRALGKASTEIEMPKLHVANEARDSVSAALTSIPTEEELGTSTLWPEIEKIYGHGYELVTLGTSRKGDLVATASHATSAEHAVVRVVSTATWALVATLPGHTLTVTRIVFSPDDARVLTVSRDRTWRLFGRRSENAFVPIASENAHTRIIFDAAWAPSGWFATAARDKTAKLWQREAAADSSASSADTSSSDEEKWTSFATLKFASGATAIAICATDAGELLAVGTEAGGIEVFTVRDNAATQLVAVPRSAGHAAAVTRLSWQPRTEAGAGHLLASAGEDRAVRVYDVQI